MTLTDPTIRFTSLRKVARTALFTAAIALGTTTLGYPAIAAADPNNGGGPGGSGEWDIGIYDNCMKNHPPGGLTLDEWVDQQRFCCDTSGGVWTSHGCTAPAAGASSPLGPGQPPARVAPPNMAPPQPPPTTPPPNISNLPAG
jgi:hypothetical protein